MRNSEKLAVIKTAFGEPPANIRIQRTTELNGVINGILDWRNIHQALSVLIGYTENGQEVPGLLRPNQRTPFFQQLITRYPPETDNFPVELFASLQEQFNGISQDIPVIVHTLDLMTPKPSASALTIEFSRKLSLGEFQEAVEDIGMVIDLLKIENEVDEVWSDFGSTVFGLEITAPLALLILSEALSGADQFREVIAAFTPETITSCFRLFNHISQSILGTTLDDRIIESDDVNSLVRSFAGAEITVGLTDDVTNEQKNGIQLAIPRLAAMTDRGWNISCSTPTIDSRKSLTPPSFLPIL